MDNKNIVKELVKIAKNIQSGTLADDCAATIAEQQWKKANYLEKVNKELEKMFGIINDEEIKLYAGLKNGLITGKEVVKAFKNNSIHVGELGSRLVDLIRLKGGKDVYPEKYVPIKAMYALLEDKG